MSLETPMETGVRDAIVYAAELSFATAIAIAYDWFRVLGGGSEPLLLLRGSKEGATPWL